MADTEKDYVLVVDDEYSNRLLLEELLSDYNVECADSGSQMWKIIEQRVPSLILMDVMMPEVDGFTLAKNLSEKERYKDVPIIFVTAKVTGEDVEKGFDIGGYDYIKKPFNQLELESRVKKALEKKKTERFLKGKAFTADKIVETMSEGILIVDPNGFIIDVNPATVHLLGYQKNELIGKCVNDICLDKDFTQHLSNERITSKYETLFVTKERKEIPVISSNSTIFEESPVPQGWVCVIHDISLQKETEKSLIEARDKAEEADKLKSAFIANMSHEIRTPMNSIVGFSELLEDPELTFEERNEYVGIIQKNSDKLLNFIDNLLDISIIEAGQIQINKGKTYVNTIMDELLASFLIIKNKLNKHTVELRVNKGSQDRNFCFLTDLYRFQQILMNLLGNAIKFTKEGYVELGYSLVDNQKSILFYVKDTGIGIPDDKKEIIFDRFGQVSHEDIENLGGTGLGLAISKQLAELLEGDLYLETQYGKGSTFFLKLPYK